MVGRLKRECPDKYGKQNMHLFLVSVLVLLAIVGGAVAILGKEKSRRIGLSELWKLAFALILFWVGRCLNSPTDSSLAAPRIGMDVFACLLTVWFLVSLVRRRQAKAQPTE